MNMLQFLYAKEDWTVLKDKVLKMAIQLKTDYIQGENELNDRVIEDVVGELIWAIQHIEEVEPKMGKAPLY